MKYEYESLPGNIPGLWPKGALTTGQAHGDKLKDCAAFYNEFRTSDGDETSNEEDIHGMKQVTDKNQVNQ